MSNSKASREAAEPQPPDDGDDTEGHNLSISPTVSRDMANSRSRDIEREARERQRAKEARGGR